MRVYRPLFNQSLKLLWRNKYLWWLGFLASLVSSGGVFNILINNFRQIERHGSFLSNLKIIIQTTGWQIGLQNLLLVLKNLTPLSFLLLTISLVVIIFIIWLAASAQGGLLFGIFRLAKGETTDWSSSFRVGREKFWPIIGLLITEKVIIYLSLIIFGLPLILLFIITDSQFLWTVLVLLSFFILIPYALIVALLIKYAMLYVVIKRTKFQLSLRYAFTLFLKNWLVSLEMALILFLLNLAMVGGLIIILLVLAAPFALFIFLGSSLGLEELFWLALVGGGLVVFIILILFNAVRFTFLDIVWTLLFVRLTEGFVFPKLIRFIASLSYKGRLKQ